MKNLKLYKKIAMLGTTGLITLTSLNGCNKQVIDFNKSFNIVVEKNFDNVSVVGISQYSDYNNSQIQFVTEDGLLVLSSTSQTQLLKCKDEVAINNYVESLVDDQENIVFYDQLANTSIDYSFNICNKNIMNLNYFYNKAIILSDGIATIVELDTWKDYKKDDKIKIKLQDGTCILTNSDKIKLINDVNANEDSLKNYALSLVGSDDKIIYYDTKINTK